MARPGSVVNRSLPPLAFLVLTAILPVVHATGPATGRDEDRPRAGGPTGFESGALTGTVTIGPGLASRRMRFLLYPDQVRPGTPSPGDRTDGTAGDVVVYLERISGSAPPVMAAGIGSPPPEGSGPPPAARSDRPGPAPVMRQEGLTFQPHLLTIVKGTTVEFPNADPIFHNVFSLSRASTFDLGRYPQGATRSVRFDRPGVVKVFCHIHSDMNAVILVLDNPHFARPDAGGRYRIDDLPPGEHRVVAWHERARPIRRTVRIEPGRETVLDFSIPLMESQDGE